MNAYSKLPSTNPFERMASQDPSAFWGRQRELQKIASYLRGEQLHCFAIIGETYIGKTTLLRYVTDPGGAVSRKDLGIKDICFVYLDANSSIESAIGDEASVQFWSDLYRATYSCLYPHEAIKPSLLAVPEGQNPIDTCIAIKRELEQLIKLHDQPVVFALDNFEGIASLPLRDNKWLRDLARSCAYIVSSRYLLHLLYHPETERWGGTSPLWSLFSGHIYLSLMAEEEVTSFIRQNGKLNHFWKQDDIPFIKRVAGRHPELVRIACAHVYEHRQRVGQTLKNEDYQFLESWIYRDAAPICNVLWHGLTDPELMGVSSVIGYPKEPWKLSPPQEVLIAVANNKPDIDMKILFELQQRGLVEQVNNQWRVFSDVMLQFVSRQEQVRKMMEPSIFPSPPSTQVVQTEPKDEDELPTIAHPSGSVSSTSIPLQPAFTYLEGKVYDYLQAHAGQVCDKEEIKQAIWENKSPTDSTLQKIIERIRRKIEPDPDNPRYLIAVRGQGYILREGHPTILTEKVAPL